jgi:hypothetical protein
MPHVNQAYRTSMTGDLRLPRTIRYFLESCPPATQKSAAFNLNQRLNARQEFGLDKWTRTATTSSGFVQ